jgi:hypothetical protein
VNHCQDADYLTFRPTIDVIRWGREVAEGERDLVEQEQHVCRLAADMVLATRALARAESAREITAPLAAIVECSLVLLVEEIYATAFDCIVDGIDPGSFERGIPSTNRRIRDLAAEFIASLPSATARLAEAGDEPLAARMLSGCKFDALSDALSEAGYLRRAAGRRVAETGAF